LLAEFSLHRPQEAVTTGTNPAVDPAAVRALEHADWQGASTAMTPSTVPSPPRQSTRSPMPPRLAPACARCWPWPA